MPGLRKLSGREVIAILIGLGFEVARIRDSHHQLRMKTGDKSCLVVVPVHRAKSLPPGTLKSIYRQASGCVAEDTLKPLFYTE